jgi:hypothetical protein
MAKQLEFDAMTDGSTPENEVPEEASNVGLSIYSGKMEVTQEDIYMPRLQLMQGLSKAVQEGTAVAGQWLVTGYEAAVEYTIVPLLFGRRRELTDEDFTKLCISNDGLAGVGAPGGVCADCPMNQWSEDTKGKRKPPKCTFIYSYVVYVIELGTPAILEFKRSGITAGKTLNTVTAQRGLGNFGVVLKSTNQQGGRGSYYIPTVMPTKVDEEVLEFARAFGQAN